jgi:hypothetical protein
MLMSGWYGRASARATLPTLGRATAGSPDGGRAGHHVHIHRPRVRDTRPDRRGKSSRPLDRHFCEYIFELVGIAEACLVRSELVKSRLATGYRLRSTGAKAATKRVVMATASLTETNQPGRPRRVLDGAMLSSRRIRARADRPRPVQGSALPSMKGPRADEIAVRHARQPAGPRCRGRPSWPVGRRRQSRFRTRPVRRWTDRDVDVDQRRATDVMGWT